MKFMNCVLKMWMVSNLLLIFLMTLITMTIPNCNHVYSLKMYAASSIYLTAALVILFYKSQTKE